MFTYILNIDLKGFFVMVKIFGQLISLMIKSKYSLKESQHLWQRKKEEKKGMGGRTDHKVSSLLHQKQWHLKCLYWKYQITIFKGMASRKSNKLTWYSLQLISEYHKGQCMCDVRIKCCFSPASSPITTV